MEHSGVFPHSKYHKLWGIASQAPCYDSTTAYAIRQSTIDQVVSPSKTRNRSHLICLKQAAENIIEHNHKHRKSFPGLELDATDGLSERHPKSEEWADGLDID